WKRGWVFRCSMFSIAPVERSSSAQTSSPSSSRCPARCEAINPAPPVISARTSPRLRERIVSRESFYAEWSGRESRAGRRCALATHGGRRDGNGPEAERKRQEPCGSEHVDAQAHAEQRR